MPERLSASPGAKAAADAAEERGLSSRRAPLPSIVAVAGSADGGFDSAELGTIARVRPAAARYGRSPGATEVGHARSVVV
jgi:hypothetical protein